MIKRLSYLGGLAIVAVVCNHAAHWGHHALLWVPYPPAPVPVLSEIGSFSYYVFLMIKQLALFSVPGFLLISGYFITYAARNNPPAKTLKLAWVRVLGLLWPYLIWSGLILGLEGIRGRALTLPEIAEALIFGKASAPYSFIPLLWQLYLLSPVIIALARRWPRTLLVVSGGVTVALFSVSHLVAVGVHNPVVDGLFWVQSRYLLFPPWLLYFALGVVAGVYPDRFRGWLTRHKYALLIATLTLAVATLVDSDWMFRLTGYDMFGTVFRAPSALYATAFLLCFLAFEQGPLPFPRLVNRLGARSMGIFLLHYPLLGLLAMALERYAPWLMPFNVVVLVPLLVVVGIGVPWGLMEVVARSPAARGYRYLFG